MSDARTIRMANLGPIHDLLLLACPPSENGVRSIAILADQLDYTPTALYKMIRKMKVSPASAAKIVALHNTWWNGLTDEQQDAEKEENEGLPVSLEDFHDYVYV